MTEDGKVYSESVRINISEDTIRSYVPKKGIDIIFKPVYDDENDKKGKKEFNATLIGSDIVPENAITQSDLTNTLAQWKSIVSDRVRVQRAQPLKHKIVTNVDRELQVGADILKHRIENLDPTKITTDENGKRWAEIAEEEIKD